MAKVGKKASVKAIEYAQKMIDKNQLDELSIDFAGKTLGKSTSWEECFNIIASGFQWTLYTGCKATGDNTTVKLWKDADLIETFTFPNSEAYDEKNCEWEWNFLYKFICEWLMKNIKKLGKKHQPKKFEAPVDVETLTKEVLELKNAIKTASAKEKKKLIASYNVKAKWLDSIMEKQAAENKAQIEAQKASEDELESLRKKKQALYMKIRSWQKKGKDTSELAKELEEVTKQLRFGIHGRKTV